MNNGRHLRSPASARVLLVVAGIAVGLLAAEAIARLVAPYPMSYPWMDQVDAIDQIVKETGVKDSIVLRKLIDEALAARHKKVAEQEHGRRRTARYESDAIESLQVILAQVLRQGGQAAQDRGPTAPRRWWQQRGWRERCPRHRHLEK